MKKLYLGVVIMVLMSSCGTDPLVENIEDCSCTMIVGKKYYINFASTFYDNCNFADDMVYRPDGFIDLIRNGGGYTEKEMSKVLRYEITDKTKCLVKYFGLDKTKLLNEPGCLVFGYTVANLLENKNEAIIPFTLLTCKSYNIGSITHLDYNPR